MEERFNYYYGSYNEGEKSADASSSFYMPGEGWGSAPQNGSSGYTWNVNSLNFIGIYQGPNAPLIDYRDVKLLSRYVTERGKIIPSRISSISTIKQRELSKAIKRARFLALMPYVST